LITHAKIIALIAIAIVLKIQVKKWEKWKKRKNSGETPEREIDA
jgi:hypothetical protein